MREKDKIDQLKVANRGFDIRLHDTLHDTLYDTLHDTLQDTLYDKFHETLYDTLYDKLYHRLYFNFYKISISINNQFIKPVQFIIYCTIQLISSRLIKRAPWPLD